MKLTIFTHPIQIKMDYAEILDCLKKDEIEYKGKKYGIIEARFTKQFGAELEVIEKK